MHLVGGAVVASSIQDDFVVFDNEAGRRQAVQITRASLEIKNPFALTTLEMMMMWATG